MQFQIEVGGTTRTVTVQRATVQQDAGQVTQDAGQQNAARFKVTVDGRVHLVDARRLDAETISMLVAADGALVNPAPDGALVNLVRRVEAAIAPGRESGAFTVSVNGQGVPVQLRVGGAGRRVKDASGAAGAGPQKITAPMTGKVVRVLVKSGDEVKAKQGLVVVEAMKMENELKAARAGRVRDVLVSEGRSVDAGAVLVIVE